MRIGAIFLLPFISAVLPAYQWPLPTEQIVRGFLAGRPAQSVQKPLPNLGIWFEADSAVKPYHSGEIIYFEDSPDMLGPIPRNMPHTIIVQHGKLLFRYSGSKRRPKLQESYHIGNDDLLFSPQREERPRLYLEVFDTQFQTVIDPGLLMPSAKGNVEQAQLYLDSVALATQNAASPVNNRPIRKFEQISSGIYNLSFRFPPHQGPPLQLNVDIDGKKMYSNRFDRIYGINSRLMLNDRDLQDIYIPDEREGKFFLGTINLQNKANSSVQISVEEQYIDGSHNSNSYNLGIR